MDSYNLAGLALVLSLFSVIRVENLRRDLMAVAARGGRPAPGDLGAVAVRVTSVENKLFELDDAVRELKSESATLIPVSLNTTSALALTVAGS